MQKNKYAIIFDMDGVLVDTNPFHKIALIQFCKKHGYDLSEDQLLKRIYGRTNKDWIANLFEEDLTVEQIKTYGEEKEALFREIYEGSVVPVAGLLPFLDLLQANEIKRAIATSAPRTNVDFILQRISAEAYFTTILDDSYVDKGKPDPEIYIKTIATLGLPPEKSIVFEDSLSGVLAAKGAGAKVIGITTTHSREELDNCDLVVDDFRSLSLEDLSSLL